MHRHSSTTKLRSNAAGLCECRTLRFPDGRPRRHFRSRSPASRATPRHVRGRCTIPILVSARGCLLLHCLVDKQLATCITKLRRAAALSYEQRNAFPARRWSPRHDVLLATNSPISEHECSDDTSYEACAERRFAAGASFEPSLRPKSRRALNSE